MNDLLEHQALPVTHNSQLEDSHGGLALTPTPSNGEGGRKSHGGLLKKMKDGSTKHIAMWNVTVNLHGNKAAFLQPDPTIVHGLAEAHARYDANNQKPPFCFVLRNFEAYLGGVKPVRVCIKPLGKEPYVNGFAFLYQYNEKYGFYAIHLKGKTWIIGSKRAINWGHYAIWLGYEEARKRYGEAKISEREALGDWDDDEELGDHLWDKGAGSPYFGLMPVLFADSEWSAKIKGTITRAEEEPQAQMDALMFILRDYEYPSLRAFGPPRFCDLSQTTQRPPLRTTPVCVDRAQDPDRKDTEKPFEVTEHERPEDVIAEAMDVPYHGVNLSEQGGKYLVLNGLIPPPLKRVARPLGGSLVSIIERERKRKRTEKAHKAVKSRGGTLQIWEDEETED